MITSLKNAQLSQKTLWAILIIYLLPGLFGRAPWSPDDALGFAQAYHFLNTPFTQWASSGIVDQPFAQDGLLSAWLAAAFGFIGQSIGVPNSVIDDCMRLSNLFWLALISWSVWQTTYRMALRPELQPENPFGNAPTRNDYARSVADASVLCLLGTLGLLLRSHFQVSELAELAGLSIMLMAAVRSFDRPIGAGWHLGLGILIAFFARGWAHLLPFLIALLLATITHPSLRFNIKKRIARAGLMSISFLLLWVFWLFTQPDGQTWLSSWQQWNLNRYTVLNPDKSVSFEAISILLKTSAWFLWPILPLSIWTIWNYRKALGEPSLRIPVFAAAGGFLILILTNPSKEANYFPLIAPLSVLAAIGLSTMKRSLVGLIDWFALLCFSFLAVIVWLGWSAAIFSWPTKIANNLEKLSPGYQASSPGFELFIALLATTAWLLLIIWRSRRPKGQHRALWRPMILSCGGVTLIWCLLMTLWLPRIDYAKSFNLVSQRLATNIKTPSTCITYYKVGLTQISLLNYHSKLTFKAGSPGSHECQYLLIEDSLKTNLEKKRDILKNNDWQTLWTGNRNSDRHERFILFQRIPQAQ